MEEISPPTALFPLSRTSSSASSSYFTASAISSPDFPPLQPAPSGLNHCLPLDNQPPIPDLSLPPPQAPKKITLPGSVVAQLLKCLVSVRDRLSPSSCEAEANAFHALLEIFPRWNAVASRCPSLWGKILRVDSDSPQIFMDYIRKSSKPGIYITSAPQDALSPVRTEAWKILQENMGQCVELSLEIQLGDFEPRDVRPLQALFNIPAPRLQALHLFHIPPTPYPRNKFNILRPTTVVPAIHFYEDPWAWVHSYSEEKPRISALTLHSCCDLINLGAAPFKTLVELDVSVAHPGQGNPTWDVYQWLRILSYLPSLEYLKVIDAILVPHLSPYRYAYSDYASDISDSRIPLPKLHTFILKTHPVVADVLLPSLSFAAVTRAEIDLAATGRTTADLMRAMSKNFPHKCYTRYLSKPPTNVLDTLSPDDMSMSARLSILPSSIEVSMQSEAADGWAGSVLRVSWSWEGSGSITFYEEQEIFSDVLNGSFCLPWDFVHELSLCIHTPVGSRLAERLRGLLHTTREVQVCSLDAQTFKFIDNTHVLRASQRDDSPRYGGLGGRVGWPLPRLTTIKSDMSLMTAGVLENLMGYLKEKDPTYARVQTLYIEDGAESFGTPHFETLRSKLSYFPLAIDVGAAGHLRMSIHFNGEECNTAYFADMGANLLSV